LLLAEVIQVKGGITLLVFLAGPVLAMGAQTLAPQTHENRAATVAVSASSSPSAQADALAEIEAGKILLKECQFEEAKAAFIRALKSTDPSVQEKALQGLRKTLKARNAFSWRNWIVEPAATSLVNVVRAVVSGGVIVLGLAISWLIIGLIGQRRGFGYVHVEDMQGEETDEARVFRLSVVAALERFKHLEETGDSIGRDVVTPFLSAESFPKRDGGLLETEGIPGGKVLGKLIGRFRIPQYRIRLAIDDDKQEPFIVVEIQEKGTSLKRWGERVPRDLAFINENRLAREVVYYLIATNDIAVKIRRSRSLIRRIRRF
jgi:hypothetical protein